MPYDQRDDDTNQFRPTYSDEDFLEAVEELEVAGSSEVADLVGCSTDNARIRLDALADRDELDKRTIGKRSVYIESE